MMSLNIEVTPESKRVIRGLVVTAGKIKDLRGFLRDAAEIFHQFEENLFDSSGSDLGKWEPLALPTLKQKHRLGYPLNILVRTGALRESLAYGTGESIERIGDNEAEFGTKVKYARFHQTGTQHMPARPIIGIAPRLIKDLTEAANRHIDAAIRG